MARGQGLACTEPGLLMTKRWKFFGLGSTSTPCLVHRRHTQVGIMMIAHEDVRSGSMQASPSHA